MADLLVMLSNRSGRRGEIIDAKPTGQLQAQTWEGSPFFVLRLTDVGVPGVRRYLEPQMAEDGTTEKGLPRYRQVARRLWKFRDDLIPAGVRQSIANDRLYETTWAAVKRYVRNILTDEEAT